MKKTFQELADGEKLTAERMARKNRRQTLEDLTTKFNNNSVENISSRTVRRLFENKYKKRCLKENHYQEREQISAHRFL